MKEFFNWLIHSRSNKAMVVRTLLLEVIPSWILANIGDIFNLFYLAPEVKALIISFLTVIITYVLGVVRGEREEINGKQ